MIEKLKKLAKNFNVLVLDDENDVREGMEHLLKNFFNKVFTAPNGKVGKEILKTEKIDLVLTDLKMPEMDGITFSKYVKNFNKEIPVIVITAYSDTQNIISLIDVGIDGYILKPIKYEQIFSTLLKEVEYLYNKEFFNNSKLITHKAQHKDEIKSIIISILDFTPYPMYAKENEDVFFINDAYIDRYGLEADDEKCETKTIYDGIYIYRVKDE